MVAAGSVIVPDPARRMPGRGASLHRVPACLAQAEKRRAFGRALRMAGVADTSRLHEALGNADGGVIPTPHGSVTR
ncbi:YlxR family protein [Longispora albida]|uniref:YlxR family protein n=1 Tax=Longispora albida TaxID=203523 RepID=UPI001FDF56E3|nr:YlxR family protein [Longispora albida]